MASEVESQGRPRPLPLSAEQQGWVEAGWAAIKPERLARLDADLTNIPTPTGEERAGAEFLVRYMAAAGLEARYQPIDERQGNAVGYLRGAGGGPTLLLYAPLDTLFGPEDDDQLPQADGQVRADLRPQAVIVDGNVIGAGAENPKAFVTCVVAAAEAVRRAGVPLRGDVVVGLGAGGMPTNRRSGLTRYNAGQGSGCSFMLEQGVRGDFAILAKPGWAVSWEEVGWCWFKVTVRGTLNYVGSRHAVPYRNPLVEAMQVIAGLEEWFPEYTARHTSGLVAPRGSVGAIQGGWPHKPSFVSTTCDLYLDVRVSPRTDPAQVKHEFGEALASIQARHPGLELDWEMIVSVPGTRTDPEHWIVQSLMRAWEHVEGRPHEPRRNTSGATDAAILRGRGLPTARLGMPPAPVPPEYAGFSLGVANVASMQRLTQALVYAIVDSCTRERGEVGLAP